MPGEQRGPGPEVTKTASRTESSGAVNSAKVLNGEAALGGSNRGKPAETKSFSPGAAMAKLARKAGESPYNGLVTIAGIDVKSTPESADDLATALPTEANKTDDNNADKSPKKHRFFNFKRRREEVRTARVGVRGDRAVNGGTTETATSDTIIEASTPTTLAVTTEHPTSQTAESQVTESPSPAPVSQEATTSSTRGEFDITVANVKTGGGKDIVENAAARAAHEQMQEKSGGWLKKYKVHHAEPLDPSLSRTRRFFRGTKDTALTTKDVLKATGVEAVTHPLKFAERMYQVGFIQGAVRAKDERAAMAQMATLGLNDMSTGLRQKIQDEAKAVVAKERSERGIVGKAGEGVKEFLRRARAERTAYDRAEQQIVKDLREAVTAPRDGLSESQKALVEAYENEITGQAAANEALVKSQAARAELGEVAALQELKGPAKIEFIDELQGMTLAAANGSFKGAEAQLQIMDLLQRHGFSKDIAVHANNIEGVVNNIADVARSAASYVEGAAQLDATVDAIMGFFSDTEVHVRHGEATDATAAEIKNQRSRVTERAIQRFREEASGAADVLVGQDSAARAELLKATGRESIYAVLGALGATGVSRLMSTGARMATVHSAGVGAVAVMAGRAGRRAGVNAERTIAIAQTKAAKGEAVGGEIGQIAMIGMREVESTHVDLDKAVADLRGEERPSVNTVKNILRLNAEVAGRELAGDRAGHKLWRPTADGTLHDELALVDTTRANGIAMLIDRMSLSDVKGLAAAYGIEVPNAADKGAYIRTLNRELSLAVADNIATGEAIAERFAPLLSGVEVDAGDTVAAAEREEKGFKHKMQRRAAGAALIFGEGAVAAAFGEHLLEHVTAQDIFASAGSGGSQPVPAGEHAQSTADYTSMLAGGHGGNGGHGGVIQGSGEAGHGGAGSLTPPLPRKESTVPVGETNISETTRHEVTSPAEPREAPSLSSAPGGVMSETTREAMVGNRGDTVASTNVPGGVMSETTRHAVVNGESTSSRVPGGVMSETTRHAVAGTSTSEPVTGSSSTLPTGMSETTFHEVTGASSGHKEVTPPPGAHAGSTPEPGPHGNNGATPPEQQPSGQPGQGQEVSVEGKHGLLEQYNTKIDTVDFRQSPHTMRTLFRDHGNTLRIELKGGENANHIAFQTIGKDGKVHTVLVDTQHEGKTRYVDLPLNDKSDVAGKAIGLANGQKVSRDTLTSMFVDKHALNNYIKHDLPPGTLDHNGNGDIATAEFPGGQDVFRSTTVDAAHVTMEHGKTSVTFLSGIKGTGELPHHVKVGDNSHVSPEPSPHHNEAPTTGNVKKVWESYSAKPHEIKEIRFDTTNQLDMNAKVINHEGNKAVELIQSRGHARYFGFQVDINGRHETIFVHAVKGKDGESHLILDPKATDMLTLKGGKTISRGEFSQMVLNTRQLNHIKAGENLTVTQEADILRPTIYAADIHDGVVTSKAALIGSDHLPRHIADIQNNNSQANIPQPGGSIEIPKGEPVAHLGSIKIAGLKEVKGKGLETATGQVIIPETQLHDIISTVGHLNFEDAKGNKITPELFYDRQKHELLVIDAQNPTDLKRLITAHLGQTQDTPPHPTLLWNMQGVRVTPNKTTGEITIQFDEQAPAEHVRIDLLTGQMRTNAIHEGNGIENQTTSAQEMVALNTTNNQTTTMSFGNAHLQADGSLVEQNNTVISAAEMRQFERIIPQMQITDANGKAIPATFVYNAGGFNAVTSDGTTLLELHFDKEFNTTLDWSGQGMFSADDKTFVIDGAEHLGGFDINNFQFAHPPQELLFNVAPQEITTSLNGHQYTFSGITFNKQGQLISATSGTTLDRSSMEHLLTSMQGNSGEIPKEDLNFTYNADGSWTVKALGRPVGEITMQNGKFIFVPNTSSNPSPSATPPVSPTPEVTPSPSEAPTGSPNPSPSGASSATIPASPSPTPSGTFYEAPTGQPNPTPAAQPTSEGTGGGVISHIGSEPRRSDTETPIPSSSPVGTGGSIPNPLRVAEENRFATTAGLVGAASVIGGIVGAATGQQGTRMQRAEAGATLGLSKLVPAAVKAAQKVHPVQPVKNRVTSATLGTARAAGKVLNAAGRGVQGSIETLTGGRFRSSGPKPGEPSGPDGGAPTPGPAVPGEASQPAESLATEAPGETTERARRRWFGRRGTPDSSPASAPLGTRAEEDIAGDTPGGGDGSAGDARQPSETLATGANVTAFRPVRGPSVAESGGSGSASVPDRKAWPVKEAELPRLYNRLSDTKAPWPARIDAAEEFLRVQEITPQQDLSKEEKEKMVKWVEENFRPREGDTEGSAGPNENTEEFPAVGGEEPPTEPIPTVGGQGAEGMEPGTDARAGEEVASYVPEPAGSDIPQSGGASGEAQQDEYPPGLLRPWRELDRDPAQPAAGEGPSGQGADRGLGTGATENNPGGVAADVPSPAESGEAGENAGPPPSPRPRNDI